MKSDTTNPFADVALSEEAIKLANIIYNTYKQEGYPVLEVRVERLLNVLGFGNENRQAGVARLRRLFEEINEPVAVTDFKFGSRRYPWKALSFCSFERPWQEGDETIEILVNEMYIAALFEFMEHPFLPVHKS